MSTISLINENKIVIDCQIVASHVRFFGRKNIEWRANIKFSVKLGNSLSETVEMLRVYSLMVRLL